MKPLKSGIEIDPNKLSNMKGGACSCGCDVYHASTIVTMSGEEGADCNCQCSVYDPSHSTYSSAFIQIN